MVKSKTKISKQTLKKTNPLLVETILLAKKNPSWFRIAEILSGSRRNFANLNLKDINDNTKEGDLIVIPGKVLSSGEITKKIKIIALNFSSSAREKLLKSKTESSILIDEIKKNPSGKGIRIMEEIK